MRCEDVQSILGPHLPPHLVRAEEREASRHLAGCKACRQYLRIQKALSERLGALAERTVAPFDLGTRIRAALGEEMKREAARHRRSRWFGGAAAALAAAAALILFIQPTLTSRPAVQSLVNEASAGLLLPGSVWSSDARELERWLESQMGYPVQILDITDAVLVGARVVDLADTRGAQIVYRYHGMPLTYFALPSGDVLGYRVPGDQVTVTSSAGYEVAIWAEGEVVRAVAAPMPRGEVVGIAEECRAKARPPSS